MIDIGCSGIVKKRLQRYPVNVTEKTGRNILRGKKEKIDARCKERY